MCAGGLGGCLPPPKSCAYMYVVCVEMINRQQIKGRQKQAYIFLMPWIELQKHFFVLGSPWLSCMVLGWIVLKYVCLQYGDVFTQLLSCVCTLQIFLLLSQFYY